VCGRSIYAEGTVDAVLFLAKKVIALFSILHPQLPLPPKRKRKTCLLLPQWILMNHN